MANTLYDRSFSGNQAIILAKQMQFEATRESFWGKFAKFNTPGGIPVKPGNIPAPVDSPIVIQNEFGKQQGDLMKIPLMRALKGLPTFGLNQLAGMEERMKINHALVPCDINRHAVLTQEGSMMTQTTKDYQILQRARPLLQRHYAQAMELLQVSYAFYHGFSYNILSGSNTRWSGNSTVKAISHPNVYIAGQGRYVYSSTNYPGTAGYETGLGTALGNVIETNEFNTTFLSGLKADQQIRRIPRIITKDGNQFWLIVAHPYQITSLEADELFNAAASRAFVGQMAKDNPLLVGAKYHYAGFFIFESDTAVWPVSVSGGSPVWGPSTIADLDSFIDYEDNEMFAAILLGSNAMFRGVASSLKFVGRVDDYEEIKGIAYRTLEACSRADYWNDDDGTRGQYLKNDGSAVLVTAAIKPNMG